MPNQLLDELDVRALGNGKDWKTLHEFRYVTAKGEVITVPAGFITDFASIPWFFRRLFQPATGRHRRGAVVHDWIYRTPSVKISKAEADKIFLAIMKLDGTQSIRREAMYNAVKMFGSGSYVERKV